MSKPISFGFGKSKANGNNSQVDAKSSKPSISLPLKKTTSTRPLNLSRPRSALRSEEDEDDDDAVPKHEAVTGFSSSGVILSQPASEKKELVIENAGNLDWRRRGKNLLPDEVRAARTGQDVIMVEKDEVSTDSGLQFAQPVVTSTEGADHAKMNGIQISNHHIQPKDADQEALEALLGDNEKPKGTAVIEQRADSQRRPQDETEDFRSDVASRPDSATLADYDAMPVEEFGLAMLRGMGKKRRANGEVINLEQKEEPSRKQRKQEGFLGIGAKPAPGMDAIELGAWGKADMRKNSKGAGFFTPLMMKNKETGETITEEELEKRKRETKSDKPSEERDWRERRDKNLARHGRDRAEKEGDDYRQEMNRFSRNHRDDGGYDSSRSRKDISDSDHDASRSRRDRSRSREGRRRDDSDGRHDRGKDRRHDKRRDGYHDDRYDSSSSRRERDRHRDKDHDREHRRCDKGYNRDDRRHRDR